MLRELVLSENQLTGSIPQSLGNLALLESLFLYSNQLTGSIPPEIGNLTNLSRYLYLGGNQLSGPIPPQLGNLQNVKYLSLSLNRLTGEIPHEFANMQSLEAMYLTGNQLSGSVPPELGQLGNLRVLHLATNQLSGSIPSSIGNLTNLNTLVLRNNALSGQIPDAITQLTAIPDDSLDIAYNQLAASSPSVISYLNAKSPNWAQSQTVPPTELQVASQIQAGATSPDVDFHLTWTPIQYTADGGYYEIGYSTTPGGDYTVHGRTTDKTSSSYTISGLPSGTSYCFAVRTFTPAHGSQVGATWWLTYQQSALTSEFSEEVCTSPPGTSTVEGVIYDDQNRNGTQDPGEPGIAGLVVNLAPRVGVPEAGTDNWQTTTNGVGLYQFQGIPSGDYLIRISDPALVWPTVQFVVTIGSTPTVVVPPVGLPWWQAFLPMLLRQ